MAETFDTTNAGNGTGLTLTVSHTNSGDTLLVYARDESGDHVTGVTYNGVAMTLQSKVIEQGGTAEFYCFALQAPAIGTHNIVITRSVATGTLYGASASYNLTKQTSFPDGSNTGGDSHGGGGGTTQESIVVSTNNSWVVMAASSDVLSSFSFVGGSGAISPTARQSGDRIIISDSNGPLSTGSYLINLSGGVSSHLAFVLLSIAPGPIIINVSEVSASVDTMTIHQGFSIIVSEVSAAVDSFLVKFGFKNIPKNNATFSDTSKNNANASNPSKNNSTWNNQQKT